MKRRIKLTSIYLYVISLLFSCSRNTIFSKGYNYEINLSPIEIAYWFDKNRYNRNECITVHISYGHDGVIDNIKDENKNLPFCLYLDYRNENFYTNDDYKNFNGYHLIEEVESSHFYTNDFSYFQERYGEKKFSHTAVYDIPYDYFKTIWENKQYDPTLKFIAAQLYFDENAKVLIYDYAEIDLCFYFDNKKEIIKLIS